MPVTTACFQIVFHAVTSSVMAHPGPSCTWNYHLGCCMNAEAIESTNMNENPVFGVQFRRHIQRVLIRVHGDVFRGTREPFASAEPSHHERKELERCERGDAVMPLTTHLRAPATFGTSSGTIECRPMPKPLPM